MISPQPANYGECPYCDDPECSYAIVHVCHNKQTKLVCGPDCLTDAELKDNNLSFHRILHWLYCDYCVKRTLNTDV